MTHARFGILATLLIWSARAAACVLGLGALLGVAIAAYDEGGGRSGIAARSLVTPDMRLREAIVWGLVFIACAIAVWLLSPERIWAWTHRAGRTRSTMG